MLRQPRTKTRERTDGVPTVKAAQWLEVWKWLADLVRQLAARTQESEKQILALRKRLAASLPALPCSDEATLCEWTHRGGRILQGFSDMATVGQWADEAEKAFRGHQAAAAKDRRDAWRQWVRDCILRRPGLLFRWIRGDTIPPTQGLIGPNGWTLDPVTVTEVAKAAWAKLWCAEGGPEPWRPRPPDGQPLPPLTGEQIHTIVRNLAGRTAAGADGWRAEELKELPEQFWPRLAELPTVCEARGAWPRALRISLITLLPKGEAVEPGGMRPIALLPLVYRIWAAARQPWVRRWAHGPGDDGAEVVGQGAVDAAWELALEAECTTLVDNLEHMCGVFLDCSKCYERIPHAGLERRARDLQFPDQLLVLALGMYSAPRHVRVGEAVSQPVQASSGILAGCGMAVALLRAHLRETVEGGKLGTAASAAPPTEAPAPRPAADPPHPGGHSTTNHSADNPEQQNGPADGSDQPAGGPHTPGPPAQTHFPAQLVLAAGPPGPGTLTRLAPAGGPPGTGTAPPRPEHSSHHEVDDDAGRPGLEVRTTRQRAGTPPLRMRDANPVPVLSRVF